MSRVPLSSAPASVAHLDHLAAGSDHGSDSDSDSDDGQPRPAADGSANEHLAVGYRHERSFVVRGNNVGVFKHTEDDKLKHSTTISNIKNKKGQSFAPSKVRPSSTLTFRPSPS